MTKLAAEVTESTKKIIIEKLFLKGATELIIAMLLKLFWKWKK